MDIRLNHPLRPFSHVPGGFYILPGTCLRFQIFPAKISVCDLSCSQPRELLELLLPFKGPVKDFTVQLDLEKDLIRVWGHSPEGFWRYHIKSHEHGFELISEKKPILIDVSGLCEFKTEQSANSYRFHLPQARIHAIQTLERLFIGVNKAQSWDQIQHRLDLAEIFPFWLHLGQKIPKQSLDGLGQGTTSFLASLQSKNKETLVHTFKNLFQAGFETLLSPRLDDLQYQGFELPLVKDVQLSPLVLLQEGARLIRSLFFDEKGDEVHILPCLPPEFHSGKFIHIQGHTGIYHLEWTKKSLRRMWFESLQDQQIQWVFSPKLKSFRLKRGLKDKGERVSCSAPLEFLKNKIYFLDCFEK